MNADPKKIDAVFLKLCEAFEEFATLTQGDWRQRCSGRVLFTDAPEIYLLVARLLFEAGKSPGPGFEFADLYAHETLNCDPTDPEDIGTVRDPKTEREYIHVAVHIAALLESIARTPAMLAAFRSLLRGHVEHRVRVFFILHEIARWGRQTGKS